MAPVRVGGPWLTVRELIELFVFMGCELREPDIGFIEPDGASTPVRYLYSPVTTDFVALVDLEMDDHVSPSEVANWERRLGMSIPKGGDLH